MADLAASGQAFYMALANAILVHSDAIPFAKTRGTGGVRFDRNLDRRMHSLLLSAIVDEFAGGRCTRYDWVYVNCGGWRYPAATRRGTMPCTRSTACAGLGHHNVERPCSVMPTVRRTDLGSSAVLLDA